MYTLKIDTITEKTHIGDIPLDLRINALDEAVKSQKKIIIYICNQIDNVCFRYRVYNICESINEGEIFRGTWFHPDETESIIDYLNYISFAIVSRSKWELKLNNWIQSVKSYFPVIFECDDLVFDLRYLTTVANTLSHPLHEEASINEWVSSFARWYMTAQLCDAYLTTTDTLKDKFEDCFNKKTYIISNFMNNLQLNMSNFFRNDKKKSTPTGPFLIGYFSGTPTHKNDYTIVHESIIEFLRTHSDSKFRILGYLDLPSSCNDFIENGQIEFKPFCSFLQLQGEMAAVDLNIAPLIENEFTDGKSNLKYFEAGIVNTPTIATPTSPYRKSITHGVNGFLAESTEWLNLFNHCYNLFKENKLQSIADNAYEHCLDHYTPEAIRPQIEAVFNNILKDFSLN